MMWELGDPRMPDNPALEPEDDIDTPSCPVCGSENYDYLFFQDDECVGCNSCLKQMDIDEVLTICKEVLKI